MYTKETQVQNEKLRLQLLSLSDPTRWDNTEAQTRASIGKYEEDDRLSRVDTVYLVGHGTSLATAMNAEFLFVRVAGVQARAVAAYEFRTYPDYYMLHPDRTLVIGLSCSGNTESVVRCLEMARNRGALTMCISGSGDIRTAAVSDYRVCAHTEIEKESDMTAYSVSHLYILFGALQAAMLLGRKRGVLDSEQNSYWEQQWTDLKAAMRDLPVLFKTMGDVVQEYEEDDMHNVIALGTGPNYGTAQEGALKICEFAWIFGACEELEDFAHGRFREIDGKIPLFIIAPHANNGRKTLDLLAGCEIAHTHTYIFAEEKLPQFDNFDAQYIPMPHIKEEVLTPFLYVYPLWYFGFHYRCRQQELVGERRFGLLATDINYDAYLKRHENK